MSAAKAELSFSEMLEANQPEAQRWQSMGSRVNGGAARFLAEYCQGNRGPRAALGATCHRAAPEGTRYRLGPRFSSQRCNAVVVVSGRRFAGEEQHAS